MVVQHDVGVQVLADVNVALHDAQERRLVEFVAFLPTNFGWNGTFWAAEMSVADKDDVAIYGPAC